MTAPDQNATPPLDATKEKFTPAPDLEELRGLVQLGEEDNAKLRERVKVLEAGVENRETLDATRGNELTEMRAELGERSAQLADRDATIATLQGLLNEKSEEIVRLNALVNGANLNPFGDLPPGHFALLECVTISVLSGGPQYCEARKGDILFLGAESELPKVAVKYPKTKVYAVTQATIDELTRLAVLYR
jgi:hypothetical protein